MISRHEIEKIIHDTWNAYKFAELEETEKALTLGMEDMVVSTYFLRISYAKLLLYNTCRN